MDGLRQYLISVTAAAIICGICKYFADEKSASGTVISLIAGLIMAITVISPIVTLELGELPALSDGFITEAKDIAAVGEELASVEVNSLIIDQLEAYTLDKAASFGAAPEVKFHLDDSMQPEAVTVCGAISPYAKVRLQQILEEDLGIAKENQQWIE